MTTRKGIASIFSSLALGTAMFVGIPGAAHAEEPVSACKAGLIQDSFDTGRGETKAFGRDGCVYSIVMGNPLPVKNYDLSDSRDAQRFANEYNRAQAGAQREADRMRREDERQQRRCQQAQNNAISRGLNDLLGRRGFNAGNAARALTECTLRR